MQTPTQRTILIDNNRIGLLGLDLAMNQALQQEMNDEAATEFLLHEVRRQNYVPDKAVSLYRAALQREYQALRNNVGPATQQLTIRILGPGCVSCNRLKNMLFDVLDQMNLAADIEDITELDEIWRYGVTRTPALIINNTVQCTGQLPTLSQVRQWVRDAVAAQP